MGTESIVSITALAALLALPALAGFPDLTSNDDQGVCVTFLKDGVTISQWKMSSERCRLYCEQNGFIGDRLKQFCDFAYDTPVFNETPSRESAGVGGSREFVSKSSAGAVD